MSDELKMAIEELAQNITSIEVVTAGNCILCGREIKMVTKLRDEVPNILFCQRCERIVNKRKKHKVR